MSKSPCPTTSYVTDNARNIDGSARGFSSKTTTMLRVQCWYPNNSTYPAHSLEALSTTLSPFVALLQALCGSSISSQKKIVLA
jgi:hypothetical protein